MAAAGVTDDAIGHRIALRRLYRLHRGVLAITERPSALGRFMAGLEVDFHWPDAKVIVEADGRETHDTPFAFERDRSRDLTLKLAEWEVIRISWRQLRDEPDRIVALLRAKLGGL